MIMLLKRTIVSHRHWRIVSEIERLFSCDLRYFIDKGYTLSFNFLLTWLRPNWLFLWSLSIWSMLKSECSLQSWSYVVYWSISVIKWVSFCSSHRFPSRVFLPWASCLCFWFSIILVFYILAKLGIKTMSCFIKWNLLGWCIKYS